eukprot:1443-Heterococcus_DN1.PRE.7
MIDMETDIHTHTASLESMVAYTEMISGTSNYCLVQATVQQEESVIWHINAVVCECNPADDYSNILLHTTTQAKWHQTHSKVQGSAVGCGFTTVCALRNACSISGQNTFNSAYLCFCAFRLSTEV